MNAKHVVLEYGDVGPGVTRELVQSYQLLSRRLDEIRDEFEQVVGMPYSVDLVREGEGRLSTGLGRKCWILMLTPEDGSEPWYSLGDRHASGESLFYFGDASLMSNKYLVPEQAAREAVREWIEHGVRSQNIQWTRELLREPRKNRVR